MKQLQRVKTWQLFALLLLMCFVSATFLRLNNIGMLQRRDAVIAADKANDQTATVLRLSDLQQFVSSHMNTDLGKGVFLQYSYSRAYQTASKNAANAVDPYGNIYEKAQEVCAPQFSHYSTAYLDCTMAQLEKYPGASTINTKVNVPIALYYHDYASPLWSPDFAGWSVLACVVIALLIVIRLITLGILRLILRHHYKRAF